MIIVHQMRGGAPDKIQLYHKENIGLIHHDYCNLIDYNRDELSSILNKGEYILPADEADIAHVNKLEAEKTLKNQEFILLPLTLKKGRKLKKVIDYNKFVPKDSDVYAQLSSKTRFKYMPYKSYSIAQAEELMKSRIGKEIPAAYKTATGSGSRGVLLVDKNRLYLGGKYVQDLNLSNVAEFINFAKTQTFEKSNETRILVQGLIPNDPGLHKINVDFFIRNSRLIGYKLTETDPAAVFTNWNWGYFHRTIWTDEMMQELTAFLTQSYSITDAFMNFEGFYDRIGRIYMVEFNWRYSNSTFEYQAVGVDPIYNYINDIDFLDAIPIGHHKFSRYWQCKLYENVDNYIAGK